MNLEKILMGALALVLAGAVAGCEVEDGEDGGGAGGAGDMGAGGEGGGAGGEGGTPATYSWVVIIDDSSEENMAGTPGADICGIAVDCAGTDVAATGALLSPGTGELCDEVGPNCAAVRSDPTAARDDGSACDPASEPTSDYVSLGMGGTLSVDFGQDLSGCTLNINEHVGSQAEAYEVYVCSGQNPTAGTCLNNDEPIEIADGGGPVEVTVP